MCCVALFLPHLRTCLSLVPAEEAAGNGLSATGAATPNPAAAGSGSGSACGAGAGSGGWQQWVSVAQSVAQTLRQDKPALLRQALGLRERAVALLAQRVLRAKALAAPHSDPLLVRHEAALCDALRCAALRCDVV